MRRFHTLLLTAATGAWLGATTTSVRSQQPTFRAATDLIAVDVQVVDADGRPLTRLRPDQFEVSIHGRAAFSGFRRSAAHGPRRLVDQRGDGGRARCEPACTPRRQDVCSSSPWT